MKGSTMNTADTSGAETVIAAARPTPAPDWPRPPAERRPEQGKPARRPRSRLLTVISAGLIGAVIGAGASYAVVKKPAATSQVSGYSFQTINSARDNTFNQLLGITNSGQIAGYFGSGAQGHPNHGYLIQSPYGQGNFSAENVPHSVQTQVTGLNSNGVSVGFWSSQNTAAGTNNNFGFWASNGKFHTVSFPNSHKGNPPVDQLLGVNDHGIAVGFYTNSGGNNRGYEYDTRTGKFTRVLVPGAPGGSAGPSLTATAINNAGDVAGFYAASNGSTEAFVLYANGRFKTLAFPGSAMTQAFGINNLGEVAGAYSTGSGKNVATHGFTWQPGQGFATVDAPGGAGTTTLNGINDSGDLVGFYTDAAGNTDGLLATFHK